MWRPDAGPGPLGVLLVLLATLGVAWHAARHPPDLAEPDPREVNALLARQLVPKSMPQGPPGSSRPDRLRALVATDYTADQLQVPGLLELPAQAQAVAVEVMNTTTGACGPCREQGFTLGRCLVEAPPGCGHVARYGQRAVGLAARGWQAQAIRDVVQFPDGAVPLPPELGLPWLGPEDAPVQAVVAVSLDSPFAAPALELWRGLGAHFGGSLAVRLLLLPPEGRDGARWSREAVAAAELGGLGALLTLLPASAGVLRADLYPRAGLDAARMAQGVEAAQPRVDALLAQAQGLELRVTPTAFVNGVRVRGMQSEAALLALIEGELAVHTALARPER